MAFQPCPSVAKTAINGTYLGENCVLTMHWFASAAITPTNLTQLATSLGGWVENFAIADLPQEYEFLSVEAKSLEAEIAPAALYNPIGSVTGLLSASPALPGNNSLAIKFTTGLTGRSARGRNYWPGFIESEVVGNFVSTGRANAIVADYQELVGAGTFVAGWQFSVLSRVTSGEPRPFGVTYPITAISVGDYVVDSQRRRLPNH